MNFIELLEQLKIDKSSIQDFDKWATYLKDIKGHSENTYRSYCFDVCDFLIFFKFYNGNSVSLSNLKDLPNEILAGSVQELFGEDKTNMPEDLSKLAPMSLAAIAVFMKIIFAQFLMQPK